MSGRRLLSWRSPTTLVSGPAHGPRGPARLCRARLLRPRRRRHRRRWDWNGKGPPPWSRCPWLGPGPLRGLHAAGLRTASCLSGPRLRRRFRWLRGSTRRWCCILHREHVNEHKEEIKDVSDEVGKVKGVAVNRIHRSLNQCECFAASPKDTAGVLPRLSLHRRRED